jgi:hypothetical protein
MLMRVQRTENAAAGLAAALGIVAIVLALQGAPVTDGTASGSAPLQVQAPQSAPAHPTSDPLPHDRVRAAAPTTFKISGPGFSITADVCGMDPVFPLDPPGDQLHTVCWVTHDFGVAPGSATKGTTYVLGHAWAAQKLVLNPLSEFATAHEAAATYLHNGVAINSVPALNRYRITLTTPNGTLGYTVKRAFLVGKLDARGVDSLMKTSTPNRVVVITCAVAGGVDLPQNVILYADLTWSKSAHQPS